MSMWFPFEVFVGFNCTEDFAIVLVPLIILLWILDTRFVWRSGDDGDGERNLWITVIGRNAFFLLVLLYQVDTLATVLSVSSDLFFHLFNIMSVFLSDTEPMQEKSGQMLHCTSLGMRTMLLLFTRRSSTPMGLHLLTWYALIYRMMVIGVFNGFSNKPHLPTNIASANSQSRGVTTNNKLDSIAVRDVANPPDDEGKLLIQLMAPQIILNMLSYSDEFVSALCEVNGTFRWISNSVEKLYGYHPNELIGRNGWSTVHPEDVAGIVKAARDTADRVRLTLRRRRKNGTYVLVDLYGLINEGFFFFQEHLRRNYPAVPVQVNDQAITPEILARSAYYALQRSDPIPPDFFDDLKRCYEDSRILGLSKDESVSFWDVVKETINRCVSMKNDLNESLGTAKTFHVELLNAPARASHLSHDDMIWCNKDRLVTAVSRLVESVLVQSANSEIRVQIDVINWEKRHLTIRIMSQVQPTGEDMRIMQAKSYFETRLKGEFILLQTESNSKIEASARFLNQEHFDEDTCLIVDDDETILRILQKKLPVAWKATYLKSLVVLTARNSDDAIRIAERFAGSRSLRLVSLDLDLGENSTLSGEQTAERIRSLDCCERIVILTSSDDVQAEFPVIKKNSPKLYEMLTKF